MKDYDILVVNDYSFEVKRISKHTLNAFYGGKKVASAPSMPKLTAKLEALYPEAKTENSGTFKAKDPQKQNIPKGKPKKAKPKKEEFISKDGTNKRLSMRQLTLDSMLDGKDDAEVLEIIKTHFPNKKYDMTHVKWYRSNFAKAELLTPEFAPKGSQAYKDWEKKNTK